MSPQWNSALGFRNTSARMLKTLEGIQGKAIRVTPEQKAQLGKESV